MQQQPTFECSVLTKGVAVCRTTSAQCKPGESCRYSRCDWPTAPRNVSYGWRKENVTTDLLWIPDFSHLCYRQLTSHTQLLFALASSVAPIKQGHLDAYSNAASFRPYLTLLFNFKRHVSQIWNLHEKWSLPLNTKKLKFAWQIHHTFVFVSPGDT